MAYALISFHTLMQLFLYLYAAQGTTVILY